jgi:ATP-dependent DNA helicase RecQ
MAPLEALHTYFGYKDFRPLQAQIIDSVLSGRDTLALMPTGGGKSICFQVPALVMGDNNPDKRLCLVITPLIALMRDQVTNLRSRGIQAAAVYTGMSRDRQRVALDNCLFGNYHFLYCSPERLESEEFRKRLCDLPIGLIAVDEAHCISQWGYDFRPSYLRIGNIRQTLAEQGKNIPVLALTATATPEVVTDIQDRLLFKQQNVLKMSYHRDNLRYIVRRTDAKDEQVIHILSRVSGSAIIYVRNRKRAEELSHWLNEKLSTKNSPTSLNSKLSTLNYTDFYHAGLTTQERNRRQQAWKEGHTRVIVATNAFGMGIDKPDVRLVIHYDLPDSLEAYYQEAGRAGRDGLTAFAVLLYNDSDKTKARKRVLDNYPPQEFVEKVYHKTCDFLQIGLGSGLNHTFALHLDELCAVMHLPVIQTYAALHLLTTAGWIHFEEERETAPRVRINISPDTLSEYHLSSAQTTMLDRLMRHHSGIFTDLQIIIPDSDALPDEDHETLVSLAQRGIITYIPRTVACAVTMTRERADEVWLSDTVYDSRRKSYSERLQAMVEYAEQTQFCREQVLLGYFGETDAKPCGKCDICIQ